MYAIYDPVTGTQQLIYVVLCVQYESNKGGKDQEWIQSSTTPDPGYQNGNVTITQFNITNESQEVSPFPAGDHKAAMIRRQSMTNTIQK